MRTIDLILLGLVIFCISIPVTILLIANILRSLKVKVPLSKLKESVPLENAPIFSCKTAVFHTKPWSLGKILVLNSNGEKFEFLPRSFSAPFAQLETGSDTVLFSMITEEYYKGFLQDMKAGVITTQAKDGISHNGTWTYDRDVGRLEINYQDKKFGFESLFSSGHKIFIGDLHVGTMQSNFESRVLMIKDDLERKDEILILLVTYSLAYK